MEAKELRIGNWVTENGRLIHIHDGFGIDHAYNFEPISLTEEWLLKFGFKRGFNTLFKQINAFNKPVTVSIEFNGVNDIAIWISENEDNENESNLNFNIDKNIKYVHQLQNLFYSLTGKELTVRELA